MNESDIKMKILIIGAGGQLAEQLTSALKRGETSLGAIPECFSDAEVVAKSESELDICNKDAVTGLCTKEKFDIIFNCAAYTNVDGCEENTEAAYAVNRDACGYLAEAAYKTDAKLVHISTDYVFDGKSDVPYTEDMPCVPCTVYGKSKLEGELEIKNKMQKYFIMRTSWLYGYNGNNFVKTILKRAEETGTLKVVCDQFGTPTFAEDLVHHMVYLASGENYGTYHCTGEGQTCSWFDFADYAVKLSGKKCDVYKCTTEEFPRPAPRPKYSRLDNAALKALGMNKMRDWKTALEEFMRIYK